MAIARRCAREGTRGFTLLEVMIVVVIVGILAAIALPSYTAFITRSKIIDATAKLSDYRASMEKYFMDNRTYLNGATCGAAPPASDYFTLSCGPLPTATTYTLQAVGIAAKGMNNFTYTIDQTNAKTSSGPGGTYTPSPNNCWALRSDGSC